MFPKHWIFWFFYIFFQIGFNFLDTACIHNISYRYMSLVSCSDKFSQIHFINYSRIISENLNTCATMQIIQHAMKEVHTKYLRVSIFCSGFIFDRKYILKIYSFFQFSKLAQCSMYNGGWGVWILSACLDLIVRWPLILTLLLPRLTVVLFPL